MKLKLLSLTVALAAFGAWQLTLAYDANNDGMSDVFADFYGLQQDSALGDEDGDTLTNLEESLWGTDPTEHTPDLNRIEPYSSSVFIFRFDTVLGKKYQIEFSNNLTAWNALGHVQRGNGSQIGFGMQSSGGKGFWRLASRGEVDADGDSLGLYEESLLGTLDTDPDSDDDYILDANEFAAATQPMVADTPPAVSFDPAAGDYDNAQSVELVNLALPDYIYYTEDGTEPTLFSSQYEGTPIDTGADANLTIRAKIILPNGTESVESAATYRVGGYKVASQTVYYGWVTADAAMGYAYDRIALASGTNTQAPENYLVIGRGWIINGSFEPDTSVASQQLYYGITGTPTSGTWQLLEGYSTDSSVFWDSGFDFLNYRPVGKGWIDKHDHMTADLENQSSQMIYYACIGFQFASGNYARQIYTTHSTDQQGNTIYAHKIAKGWVTSHESMQPDTSTPSTQIRYGVVVSLPAIVPYKRVATNHADDIYPTSLIRDLNSVRVGKGWAMGTSGMIPDTSEASQTLYYGEKTSYTYSNSGDERVYSTHASDITPSIYRRVVTVGPGYLSSPLQNYEITWLNNAPNDVYEGTETVYPSSLPHETDFLAYNTSELTGTVNSLGLGWIENNTFIEYVGTGDTAEDIDGDGLSLQQEMNAGTNPNFFDTDGDLIPDGFEVASAHLDPLVADALRGEDFDGDGLDTYLELINGSNPDEFDTDGDLVGDGEEVDYGTDPFDVTSKPFDPYDFVGPTLTDPNCQPLGDLGVFQPYNASTGYSVTGKVGDPSSSNSERWRLLFGRNSGNRKAESQQFGVVDDYTLNLHGNTIFEITLEHVGTDPAWISQGNQPDYDYEATITEKEGFLFSDPDGLLGTDTNVDLTTVEAKKAYLVPIKSVSFSESFYGGDAVGPRYRKVALNGRPMPDAKPEQEAETEQHNEETYIDAFDLSLHHDTSYIYTPLASSDLVLQATASVRETSWSDRSGLKPHESLTMPFGAAWSSNLCAYVESVETIGDVQTDPISINVVDESGRSQRFATNNLVTFFPWPSSRVDKKTWLNTLNGLDTDSDGAIDRLVYTKKYGTTLTYDLSDAWFMYSTDRIDGSNEVKRHRYFRLTEVEDRYGNIVTYDYDADDSNSEDDRVSLIPQVIQSSQFPGQFISIQRSADCRRIERITDSRANTIDFNYSDVPVFGSTLSS
jgi:hypothetical protein